MVDLFDIGGGASSLHQQKGEQQKFEICLMPKRPVNVF